jgi:hypothetical protein
VDVHRHPDLQAAISANNLGAGRGYRTWPFRADDGHGGDSCGVSEEAASINLG